MGSGLLTLDDLQVDEAWLSFEYSTSYVAPRTYGESDEDDDGFDTVDNGNELEREEIKPNGENGLSQDSTALAHGMVDTNAVGVGAQSVVVVGKKGARDRAARSKKIADTSASRSITKLDPTPVERARTPAPAPAPDSKPEPVSEPPKAVYSATAAAAALNAFLSSIGVIPVADGEEMDEYVLEYLSGYIAECHASGEDCAAFTEGFRELLENFVWAVYGGESETTDEKLSLLYSAAAE